MMIQQTIKSENLYSTETERYLTEIMNKHPLKEIGFTCSSFDLLHTGHVIMLEDSKKQCDILVVALQTDPTLDRNSKNKPVQTYEERFIMLQSIKYLDYVVKYATEEDLLNILKFLNPSVRILGTDWKDKKYTGDELPIPVYFHDRNHDYSTSNLRKRVHKAEEDILIRK